MSEPDVRDADHAANTGAAPEASLRRLRGYARPHWRVLVLGGALTFLGGLTSLSQSLLAEYVIDALGAGEPILAPVLALAAVILGGALIVVMDAGRVRAVGTHGELVAGDDLYRGLAAGQLLTAEAP